MCVGCLFIKDTEPSPLQDSFSVRKQGGPPRPPPCKSGWAWVQNAVVENCARLDEGASMEEEEEGGGGGFIRIQ